MPAPLLTVTEARNRVLSCSAALAPEEVPVQEALGRTLGVAVRAHRPAPPFDASAMDGYAVTAAEGGRLLEVSGESRAGHPAPAGVRAGEAVRISTGAAVPTGTVAVVRQEDATVLPDGRIELLRDVAPGANIRRAGEDLEPGAETLPAGVALGPPELGAAVTAGAATVWAHRRPTASVLCTGDELRPPGASLGPGQIHNSNGIMLAALARRSGADPEPVVHLADEPEATRAGLGAALERADVVLISGGVSVGPHDHVKQALRDLGVKEVFWGVALQPGKPTWFGTRGSTLVFGLPGNPVSAVVTFTLFAASALAVLGGRPDAARATRAVALGVPVRRNRSREQALRVRLEEAETGEVAVPNGPQGSHIVSSLLGARALALVPPGEGELPAGSGVLLHPLPW